LGEVQAKVVSINKKRILLETTQELLERQDKVLKPIVLKLRPAQFRGVFTPVWHVS